VDNNPHTRIVTMLEVIQKFLDNFKKTLMERHEFSSSDDETKPSKALFAVLFVEIFNDLKQKLNEIQGNQASQVDLRKRIKKAMKNSVNIEGFASIENVFKSLVKEEIKLLEQPAIECARKVHGKLEKMVEFHLKGDTRFERLNEKIRESARKVLAKQLKETKNMIRYHITLETDMIYSSDKKFLNLLEVIWKLSISKFHRQ